MLILPSFVCTGGGVMRREALPSMGSLNSFESLEARSYMPRGTLATFALLSRLLTLVILRAVEVQGVPPQERVWLPRG